MLLLANESYCSWLKTPTFENLKTGKAKDDQRDKYECMTSSDSKVSMPSSESPDIPRVDTQNVTMLPLYIKENSTLGKIFDGTEVEIHFCS